MHNNNHYGGIIWTNHALERLGQRGLTQKMALETFQSPDRVVQGKNAGTQEFQKKYNISLVTLIGKKNEKGEWLVLSVWIDPPLPGTMDDKKRKRYQAYQKASFWGKVFITVRDQLGL